jgi:hypothetical protein
MNQPTHQHARLPLWHARSWRTQLTSVGTFVPARLAARGAWLNGRTLRVARSAVTAIVLVIQFWLYPALLWKLQEE